MVVTATPPFKYLLRGPFPKKLFVTTFFEKGYIVRVTKSIENVLLTVTPYPRVLLFLTYAQTFPLVITSCGIDVLCVFVFFNILTKQITHGNTFRKMLKLLFCKKLFTTTFFKKGINAKYEIKRKHITCIILLST